AHAPAESQNVGQIEGVGLGAGGPDDQIAGAEAQDHVPEQIAALLLDGHAGGVVSGFAFADLQTHAELPRREHHVNLLIEQEGDDAPQDQKHDGDEQVAAHVDADIQETEVGQNGVPPIQDGKDDGQENDGADDDNRPQPPQRHVGDKNNEEQDRAKQ